MEKDRTFQHPIPPEQLDNLGKRIRVARSQILVHGRRSRDGYMVIKGSVKGVKLEATTPVNVSPEDFFLGIEWIHLPGDTDGELMLSPNQTYALGTDTRHSKERPIGRMGVRDYRIVDKLLVELNDAIRAQKPR